MGERQLSSYEMQQLQKKKKKESTKAAIANWQMIRTLHAQIKRSGTFSAKKKKKQERQIAWLRQVERCLAC